MGVQFVKYLWIFILFHECENEKENIVIKKEISLDGIDSVPERLKLNVVEVFISEGLNVWIPTNSFQTFSLIKVPRFSRKSTEHEWGFMR